ncbi:hypothetical protein FQN57_002747 [Myotisia sp. PD_48]|nr:hypothetical protein FQN57_002747 [Myotisia sp. PD_48]
MTLRILGIKCPKHPRCRREIIVRLACAVLAVVGVALFGVALTKWDDISIPLPSVPISGKLQDGIPILPLGLSILINFGLAFYTFLRRRPPHLGIQLGLDLSICTGLVPAVILSAWAGTFRLWKPTVTNGTNFVMCNEENKYARECFPVLYDLGSLQLAGVIFACACWLLHFSFFLYTIYTCQTLGWKPRYKRRRRRHRHGLKKERIIVCLEDPEVCQDRFAPYFKLPEDIPLPAKAFTKYP